MKRDTVILALALSLIVFLLQVGARDNQTASLSNLGKQAGGIVGLTDLAPALPVTPQYEIIDLGFLPELPADAGHSQGKAINDLGMVVGDGSAGPPDEDGLV